MHLCFFVVTPPPPFSPFPLPPLLPSPHPLQVVPDKAPPGGTWKVTPRWVVDSEKYNEWMNPADYTTPDFDAEMEAAEAAGGKEVGLCVGCVGEWERARVLMPEHTSCVCLHLL